MRPQEHIPVGPRTTFEVGGSARFFVEAESIEEIQSALSFTKKKGLSLFVLGGGSNILVADEGFAGLVLVPKLSEITFGTGEHSGEVTAGAGVVWDDLVVATLERGLAGFECLSGVPGSVGGAVVANVGCYGAQCSTTFVRADVIDLHNLNEPAQTLKKADCDFSYHDSLFGKNPGRYVVLNATFALATDGVPRSAYKDSRFDLTAMTEDLGHVPTVREVRNIVLTVREEKGTLIMPGRTSYKCAGSFFHMPFVSAATYADVVQRAQKLDAEMEERLRPWAWVQSDGTYKLAPGFLLEYTEFKKGYVRGNVGISPRHTLSIINLGGARAREIAQLARDMQHAVEKIFGVRLEREVEYVGAVESE